MKRVYGGLVFRNGKQVRAIIQGSQADAVRATGLSLTYIKHYWSTTGNTEEIEIAQSKPCTLFVKQSNVYSEERS